MSAPTIPTDREPVTYFELQRRRDRTPEPGESNGGDIPKLPADSPWASDPCGPEPLIDRTEDQSHG
jgi:hypothetical protein